MEKYLRADEALLHEDNPFSFSIVGDAWDTCLDVEAINHDLNLKIERVLERVQATKKSNMYLIQGEPGMGKTHFLARIRTKYAADRAYFLQIRPLPSIVAPYQFFLHEIITSLRKKPAKHMQSPFFTAFGTVVNTLLSKISDEHLANKHVIALKEQIVAQPQDFGSWKLIRSKRIQRTYQQLIEDVVSWITLNVPDVDLQFIRALFQVFNYKVRNLALLWLQGDELLPEQLAVLNISQSITLDDMALRVIKSLCILLPRPIVLSVDQLESIAAALGEQGLCVLFEILTRIHDLSPNVLILLMCQTQLWHDVIAPTLKESTKARIDEYLTLQKPNTEEAREIVSLRLEQVWEKVDTPIPYPTYPFTPKAVGQLTQACGWNPRNLLKKLENKIREFKQYGKITTVKEFVSAPDDDRTVVQGDSLEEVIDSTYNQLVRQTIKTYPKMGLKEKQDFLLGSLIELFRTMETFPVGGLQVNELIHKKTSSRQKIQLRVIMGNEHSKIPVVVEVNNNKSPNSVLASLKRLLKASQTNQLPLFIRDSVLSISKTAKKTQETLDDFKQLGFAWFISDDEFISLHTGRNFLLEVQDQGFSFEDESIGKSKIQAFLAARIYLNLPLIQYLQKQFAGPSLKGSLTPTTSQTTSSPEDVPNIRDPFTPNKIVEELEKVPVLSCASLATSLQVSEQEIIQSVRELASRGDIAVINDDQSNFLVARKPKL